MLQCYGFIVLVLIIVLVIDIVSVIYAKYSNWNAETTKRHVVKMRKGEIQPLGKNTANRSPPARFVGEQRSVPADGMSELTKYVERMSNMLPHCSHLTHHARDRSPAPHHWMKSLSRMHPKIHPWPRSHSL